MRIRPVISFTRPFINGGIEESVVTFWIPKNSVVDRNLIRSPALCQLAADSTQTKAPPSPDAPPRRGGATGALDGDCGGLRVASGCPMLSERLTAAERRLSSSGGQGAGSAPPAAICAAPPWAGRCTCCASAGGLVIVSVRRSFAAPAMRRQHAVVGRCGAGCLLYS